MYTALMDRFKLGKLRWNSQIKDFTQVDFDSFMKSLKELSVKTQLMLKQWPIKNKSHLTGAEMTAWALVYLFWTLLLKTKDTNCFLVTLLDVEILVGASQGILGTLHT